MVKNHENYSPMSGRQKTFNNHDWSFTQSLHTPLLHCQQFRNLRTVIVTKTEMKFKTAEQLEMKLEIACWKELKQKLKLAKQNGTGIGTKIQK